MMTVIPELAPGEQAFGGRQVAREAETLLDIENISVTFGGVRADRKSVV